MRRSILLLAALAALAGCSPSSAAVRAPVRTGVDMLETAMPAVLAGKRIGLITNHTGQDASGRSTIDVLAADDRFELVALYGPEHGLRGTAAPGEEVDSSRDSATGLPIHSLYGATRKPTAAMLKGVEVLVFDIQDVGSRTYTYIYTMALAMEAARDAGIPFVVLDRPNPIGGTIVEGSLLDTAYASFVGMYPMPVRHGMTVGELARFFNESIGIGAELTVVPMEGWRRDMWFDETGLPWTPPSPNIPRLSSAISYPGTVFFEGINLSEGRGTDHPFEQTGASWLRADSVVAAMQALDLPGVRFEAVTITASAKAQVFPGQTFPGVRLVITDRDAYRPLDASLRLIDTIRRLHPTEFQFTGKSSERPDLYWIDRLAGTNGLRKAMEQGTLDALLADWSRQASEFERSRARFLLY